MRLFLPTHFICVSQRRVMCIILNRSAERELLLGQTNGEQPVGDNWISGGRFPLSCEHVAFKVNTVTR